MPEDNKVAASSHLTWLVWALGVFLLAYPLSIGPVAKLTLTHPGTWMAAKVFYRPLGLVAGPSGPARDLIDRYVNFWIQP